MLLRTITRDNNFARRTAWRIGRKLYRAARGEPDPNLPELNGETDLARRVIVGSDTASPLIIIDVGANVGNWIRPVLEALPVERQLVDKTKLFAFEPVPETRERLTDSLLAHPRGHLVKVEECALSKATGEAEMTTFAADAGTHTLRAVGDLPMDQAKVIKVKLMSLSDFAAARTIEHIDLVKIDTEGHDRLVLEGALPLFKAGKIGVAQFEYNHRWVATRSFLKDVFDMMQGLPYSVARLMPDRLELFEAWHPELERFFEANYAVVHVDALGRLNVHRGHFDISNTYA